MESNAIPNELCNLKLNNAEYWFSNKDQTVKRFFSG